MLALRRCYDVRAAAARLGVQPRALESRLERRHAGGRGLEPTPRWWPPDVAGVWLVDADSCDALGGDAPDARAGMWLVLDEPAGLAPQAPTADLSGLVPGVVSAAAHDALAREREGRELAEREAAVEREARVAADAAAQVAAAVAEREVALAQLERLAAKVRALEAVVVEQADQISDLTARQLRLVRLTVAR